MRTRIYVDGDLVREALNGPPLTIELSGLEFEPGSHMIHVTVEEER
jgi:hypothetical protein